MTEYSKETIKTYWAMISVTTFKHAWLTGFTDFNTREKFSYCVKCNKRVNDGYSLSDERCCPIPDKIPLCPTELAFFMRDKCQEDEIAGGKSHWNSELGKITGLYDTGNLLLSTPDQWIDAAVKAWKGRTGNE